MTSSGMPPNGRTSAVSCSRISWAVLVTTRSMPVRAAALALALAPAPARPVLALRSKPSQTCATSAEASCGSHYVGHTHIRSSRVCRTWDFRLLTRGGSPRARLGLGDVDPVLTLVQPVVRALSLIHISEP